MSRRAPADPAGPQPGADRRPARTARLRRTLLTAGGAALGMLVLVLPLLEAVGGLLLAPPLYRRAAYLFAAALWAVLVAAAWSYRPPSA